MATVVPFRAWRYDLDRVGGLFPVQSPPYDVIGPSFQEELYRLSPYNVVRVDLGKKFPEDNAVVNRYTRSAALVREWKKSGVLARDPQPAISVVRESYTGPDGKARERRGFLALVKLADFSERIVFPHEATLSGPKEDRYQLMQATRMSLSPVFLLYSLPGDDIMAAWDSVGGTTRPPAASSTDPVGTTATLWPTTNAAVIKTMNESLAGRPLLIADGHHRYETALRYRDARHAAGDGEGPWDYVLAYLCNMDDPGLAIFATHRMVRDLPESVIANLPGCLEDSFAVELLTTDAAAAPDAIDRYLTDHRDDIGPFGLYLPGRGAYGLLLGDPNAAEASADDIHTMAYHQLDVAILHNVILLDHLGITPEHTAAGEHLTFVKKYGRSFERLDAAEFQAGFFMNPIKLPRMLEVAIGGERLPQKSTYFYPKLPTGLVFYDLSGE